MKGVMYMTIEEMKRLVGGDEALKANADIIRSWRNTTYLCDKTDIIEINEKFIDKTLSYFVNAMIQANSNPNTTEFDALADYDCDVRLAEGSKLKSVKRLYYYTQISPIDSEERLLVYCDKQIYYDISSISSEKELLTTGNLYKIVKIFPDEYNYRLHVYVKKEDD
jgi:hypothetical protein